MSRAVLSIGSNLGDRLATLQLAVDAFAPWLVAVSAVYETPPWGPVEQPDFLNAVLIVDDPAAAAHDWLNRAHDVEAAAGRVRVQRWGPRTLDVDVIDVDGLATADPVLTLPHPRAAERGFVLLPWAEVDPDPQLLAMIGALPDAERHAAVRRPELVLRVGSSQSGSIRDGRPSR
jgi:2-amino-4-hydroxy-6-hydroxymethyldihydropteridine diphosphokinase